MLEVDKCRHFTGLLEDQCDAGVLYTSVMGPFEGGQLAGDPEYRCRIPCLPCGAHLGCSKREYPTAEEAEADKARVNAAVARFMERIGVFERRESEACPTCGEHVDRLQKVGRCVYARPCNCRLWQGIVPQAWRNS
jgi:hypothetical protein